MGVIRQLGVIESSLNESASEGGILNENVIMDVVDIETELRTLLKKHISDPTVVSSIMKIVTFNYKKSVVSVVKKFISDSLVKI